MITLREIRIADNPALAQIIRNALREFDADKPGTVYYDPTTDDLYSLFKTPLSKYFVATEIDEILGGAGIFPSAGLPPDTTELVKMYLHPGSRGKGLGGQLINEAIKYAKKIGYKYIYLETLPELSKAVKVYEAYGFQKLNSPLGNTGHFGCSMWMIRQL